MNDATSWKEHVISVPRPIPRGYMVGMRNEIRNGDLYVVEFLERVPRHRSLHRPPTAALETDGDTLRHPSLRIDLERDGRVVLSWSRGAGFTVYDISFLEEKGEDR